jgi:hypothetical protein
MVVDDVDPSLNRGWSLDDRSVRIDANDRIWFGATLGDGLHVRVYGDEGALGGRIDPLFDL